MPPISLLPPAPRVAAGNGRTHRSPDADSLLRRAAAMADRWRAEASEETAWAGDADEWQFPVTQFEELAEAGLLAAPLSAEHGGAGLGTAPDTMPALLRVLRHVGRADLCSGRIYEGHVNAWQLLSAFGKPALLARLADDLREHRHISGVWNAENPAEGLRVIPRPGGGVRLEGAKTFCSGAGHVQRPFVNGRLPDGRVQMCVVPMDEVRTIHDADWWRPMGMRGTASYRIDFTGVELGPEWLVGGPDDYEREPWFSAGAMRFVAVHAGGAEALFDDTRAFLARGKRTEDHFQLARIAEMAGAVETTSLWLNSAASAWEAARETPEAGRRAIAYTALLRMTVEDLCLRVLTAAERCVGARGLMEPLPFGRLVRDLRMYLRQPVPDLMVRRSGEWALATHPHVPAHALWPGGEETE